MLGPSLLWATEFCIFSKMPVMKLVILLFCMPAWVLAQEPVKPVISSGNYVTADFSVMSKQGIDLGSQVKAVAGTIKSARSQLQASQSERTKLSAELAEKKKNRSGLDAGTVTKHRTRLRRSQTRRGPRTSYQPMTGARDAVGR